MNKDQLNTCENYLAKYRFKGSSMGIVLGTGLGKLIDSIEIKHIVPYSSIPHFPTSTVESHSGNLIFGMLSGINVIAMQGRFHLYEGYSAQEVSFPIRVLKKLGVNHLFISNAAGGINLDYKKGDLMILKDQINLQGQSPVINNDISSGNRFPDMSSPFSKELIDLICDQSKNMSLVLHSGIYASVPGPHLETRAEYRFLKIIGADAVGMSTVPEVIVCNQIGLPCVCISVITDICNPDDLAYVNIQDILEAAAIGERKLIELLERVISIIPQP